MSTINHRHGWLAVTSGLLLLLLPFLHQDAHADTLPPYVSSGYTMSMDDVVGTHGTSLDVPSMLSSASSAGNTTAIFNASGLEFQGTLTITCLATTTGWATTSLQVHILNGKTTTIGSIPNPHINVTGILSHGSSIVVDGGMYTYSGDFIHIPAAFTIQDGSSLVVHNTVMRVMPFLDTATNLLHVSPNSSLTISDNSTVSISGNTIAAKDSTSVAKWDISVLFIEAETLIITNNSTVSVTDNYILAEGLEVSKEWSLTVVNFNFTDDNSISIDFSSLLIAGNAVDVKDVHVMVCKTYILYMYGSNSPLSPSVSGNSTVSISNNNITANNVTVSGDWNVAFAAFNGLLPVDGRSNMDVSNNTMTATGSSTPTTNVLRVKSLLFIGTLSVVGNVIPQGTVVTISFLIYSGVLEAVNNTVDGAGYMFDIGQFLGKAGITLRTCANYVNTNTLCDVQNGHYTCSEGTGLDGHVQDCATPPTTTTTTTRPATGDTLVDFATVNHTTAAQLQKEVDPYGGSVTSNIQATEDGTHTYVVSFPDAAEADRAIAAANRGELPGVTGATPHSNPPPSSPRLIVGVSVGASVAVLLIVGVVWYVRRGKSSSGGGGEYAPLQAS